MRSAIYRSGAIRRASVEKELYISYENFVNELDTGDSFTASLIDILVKVRQSLCDICIQLNALCLGGGR